MWNNMTDREQTVKRITVTLNYLFIGIFSIGIGYLSSAFYLGTQETYKALMYDLPHSFIGRWMSSFLLGVILIVLIFSLPYTFGRWV